LVAITNSQHLIRGARPTADPHIDVAERDWRHRYARWLLAVDAIAVVSAVGIAQWLRFGDFSVLTKRGTWSYIELSIAIAVGWLLALWINHSRSERIIGSGAEEYRRVWIATISTFGVVAITSMLVKLEIARGYLMIALPIGAALLLGSRWVARLVVRNLRFRSGGCVTRVLAVGSAEAVRDLAVALAREPWAGYVVVGACIVDAPHSGEIEIPGAGAIPIFGEDSEIVDVIATTNSQAVAVTATEKLDGRKINALSWDLEKIDIDLLFVPSLVDVAGPRLHMRPVAGLPLIHVEKPQYHGAQRFKKRAYDIGFSCAVLIGVLPLLLAISVAIKLTSKGPVFYRHQRIGINGETFEMIKFRTMVVGADAMAHELAKLDLVASPRDPFKFVDDPRITSIGRFLRKYSLDEVPQFLNVLKGEMSVVGPRPQVESEVEAYDATARRRLLVRPGITGLWQVSGRSNLSLEDSLRLDLFYVENWSMIADLLITLQTVKAVLRPSGAY
jgi:exopolysaccharide biosynthesis polyprenyl glycosylphosphotransferase